MLEITLSCDATTRLYSIMKEEDDNACVRVREFKVGTANNPLKIVLSLSIDERDDEDLEGEAETLPFIMHRELVEQYGSHLYVSLDAHRTFVVIPASRSNPNSPLPVPDKEEKLFWQRPIIIHP